MKTLARMATFTALIGGISLANARADNTSVYVAGKATNSPVPQARKTAWGSFCRKQG